MKKNIHRIIALILALVMVFALAACAAKEAPKPEEKPAEKPAEETKDTQEPAKEEEPQGTDGEYAPTRDEPLVIKFGICSSGREDDINMPSYTALMEYVEEHTGGMITFDFYPDCQLGSESEMLDQVIADTLDMSTPSASVISTVCPEMNIYMMPFAFSSVDNFYDICGMEGYNNGEFNTKMQEIVADTGLFHFVCSCTAAFRGNHNSKRLITQASDFEGLSYRVMAGEIFADIYRSMGASTATIAFSELFSSLQQGVVEGQDVGIAMCLDYGFNEVTPYTSELNINCTPNPLIISNKLYNELSEEEYEILMEACKLSEVVGRDYLAGVSDTYYAKAEEAGMSVLRNADISDEGRQSFIDATAPVWEKYAPECGAIYDTLVKVRDAVNG